MSPIFHFQLMRTCFTRLVIQLLVHCLTAPDSRLVVMHWLAKEVFGYLKYRRCGQKKSIVSSVVLACATPHSGLLKLCDPRSYQTLHQFEQESLDRLLHTVLAAAQFPLYAHAQYATSRPAVFHAGLEQPADLSICKQAKGKRCGESKEERSTPKSLTAFLRSPPDSFR